MLHKSKEQFDSGGIIYDAKILIRYNEKLETEEDVDRFIEEQLMYLKCDLMVKSGYYLDDEIWVKETN